MVEKNSQADQLVITRTEIIRSPALYQEELEVVEYEGCRGRRFGGTHIKDMFMPLFYKAAKYTPYPVAMTPLYINRPASPVISLEKEFLAPIL